MSQVNTQQMGRLVAAGSKDRLDEAIEILARLEALHIIDYDGGEEGFSLGSPKELPVLAKFHVFASRGRRLDFFFVYIF